jgi:acetylornithine deacetylase/succinyl-diaminopimelate desuccinylase-like protein
MERTAPVSRKNPDLQKKKVRQASARRDKILATLAELEQIQSNSPTAARAIALFKSWLRDESGYDEQVWPRLKKALEQERRRAGARSLFRA